MTLGVSQAALAAGLGCSQSRVWRIESGAMEPSLSMLSEMASVLGLELALTLHPIGDGLRDKGQQAVLGRFTALLGPTWRRIRELLLPGPGDRRAWDLFLRIPEQRVGVDCETRIRDVQAIVRRTRERERDGGADEILIVLSDSAANRRIAPELREALGPGYATSRRLLLRELRQGRSLSGSGVLLV